MVDPLIFTDALLEDPHLEPEEKVVVAAMLGAPRRQRSTRSIAKATGLDRHTVIATQKRLGNWRAVVVGPDTMVGVVRSVAELAKRKQVGANGQVRQATTKVASITDPRRDRWKAPPATVVEVPGELLERLPSGRGRRDPALIRLLVAVYAREQLKRHGIHMDDLTAARILHVQQVRDGWLEGPGVKTIKAARETLERAGVLVAHGSDQLATVYTMPGATPGKTEEPEKLATEYTRSHRTLRLEGERLDFYAHDRECEQVARIIRRLGDEKAIDAIWNAGIDPLMDDAQAPEILAALTAARDDGPEAQEEPIVASDDDIPV